MKNTTTPMDDNGDDSFDWREDWEPMTPEELEAAFPDIHEDVISDDDEQMYPRDTELSGDMDPESW
jgi:hypothetical protein